MGREWQPPEATASFECGIPRLPIGTRLNGSHGAAELPAKSVTYSPDGQKLLVTHAQDQWESPLEGNTFVLWDVSNNRPKAICTGHGKNAHDGSFAGCFSPDGRLVAVDSSEWSGQKFRSRIRILDSESMREVRHIEGYDGVALRNRFSPDGRYIIAVTGNTNEQRRRLRIWKTDGSLCQSEFLQSERSGDFLASTISPDGRILATNRDNVELYDFPSLRLIKTLPFGLGERGAICFSRDGRLIAAGDSKIIHLWNLEVKPKWQLSARTDFQFYRSLSRLTDRGSLPGSAENHGSMCGTFPAGST